MGAVIHLEEQVVARLELVDLVGVFQEDLVVGDQAEELVAAQVELVEAVLV